MKTIYDPRYRRLIGKLKQVRHEKQLRQVDAAQASIIGFLHQFIPAVIKSRINSFS